MLFLEAERRNFYRPEAGDRTLHNQFVVSRPLKEKDNLELLFLFFDLPFSDGEKRPAVSFLRILFSFRLR